MSKTLIDLNLKGRGMRLRIAALGSLIASFVLLAGCISVETTVFRNGNVRRAIIVDAPTKHADAVKAEVESVIGSNWKASSRKEGHKELLVFERYFAAKDAQRPFQSISFVRRRQWLLPITTYEYTETIELSDYFTTPREIGEAKKTKLIFHLEMPGQFTETNAQSTQQAAVPILTYSSATWTGNLGSSIPISATSQELRVWWLLIELVVVGCVILGIARVVGWIKGRGAASPETPSPEG